MAGVFSYYAGLTDWMSMFRVMAAVGGVIQLLISGYILLREKELIKGKYELTKHEKNLMPLCLIAGSFMIFVSFSNSNKEDSAHQSTTRSKSESE